MEIYKPNPSVKGCGASFSYNSSPKQSCIFLNLIQQVGWDKNKPGPGKGSFKGGKEAVIKFSVHEAGLIKKVLETRKSLRELNNNSALYHNTDTHKATIDLTYYSLDKERDGKKFKTYGFTFSISKEEKSDPKGALRFTLPLTIGEAAALESYLKVALEDIFRSAQAEKTRAYSKSQQDKESK